MIKPLGLYFHIPFCISRCNYCDFVSSTYGSDVMIEYVKAMLKELNNKALLIKDSYYVDSIYFGGGTPTTLYKGAIFQILNEISRIFNLKDCEITIEGNPNTFNVEKALELKGAGINRVSIGIQSMNDELLLKLGRNSTKAINEKALDIVCKYFNNINADMMLGIPLQTLNDVTYTVNELIKYPIKHISAYSLILEEGTKLHDMVLNKEITVIDDDTAVDMYDEVLKTLLKNGFNRYEISNFSKSGFECRHNIKYWTRDDYLGLGVSAHSLIDNIRTDNIIDIKGYINKINDNESVINSKVEISRDEQIKEYIMLGLRMEKGIDISLINHQYNMDFLTVYEKTLKKLKQFLFINNNNISIRPQYMNIMNSIIVEFI